MQPTCRLIITADDFGLSPGVNRAVAELARLRLVTAASLMVAEPAAAEAVELARELPSLDVGLHAVLAAGRTALTPEEISALARPNGRFRESHTVAGLLLTFSRACRSQMEGELRAQFDRFKATGLTLSHVDSHRHLHLTPVFAAALARLGAEMGAAGYRVPEDDIELHYRAAPEEHGRRRLLDAIFRLLCRPMRRRAQALFPIVADHCYGLYQTGRLTPVYLERLVLEMPPGLHELHCHPDLSHGRAGGDFAALSSPRFSAALQTRGVQLCGYRECAEG